MNILFRLAALTKFNRKFYCWWKIRKNHERFKLKVINERNFLCIFQNKKKIQFNFFFSLLSLFRLMIRNSKLWEKLNWKIVCVAKTLKNNSNIKLGWKSIVQKSCSWSSICMLNLNVNIWVGCFLQEKEKETKNKF